MYPTLPSHPLYWSKVPHNLQPTETPKQISGEDFSSVDALHRCGTQMNVLGHNCDPFSVNGAEVGIFYEAYYICLCSFQKAYDSIPLEVHIIFAHF